MAFNQVGDVLTASDAAASAQYGSAVAFNSTRTVLAVGARNSNAQKGKVYIYDVAAGVPTQRGSPITAPDGAIYDSFGDSLSLSDDGTVLAIGAPGWEGGLSNQGAVYVYDWTTVWTLRGGAPLTASDAAADDAFGTAVSLSSTGAILAVGAPTWEGAAADQGGVYIFDWTTVWTQRGSVITAPDAAAGRYFGSGVGLSSAGSVLVVGSERWSGGGGTLQGAVYTFDWTTVWTQRGSVLTASDAGPYDGFGATASLSGDGTKLAVYASRWKNNDYKGRVYIYAASGSTWTESSNFSGADSVSADAFGKGLDIADSGLALAIGAMQWEGTLTDQGGVYFLEDKVTGTLTAPTTLTVINPGGTLTAPTTLSIIAKGTLTAPTTLAIIDATHAPNWTARCLIDGVDVSASLEGTISVTADEGAARIASLAINPPSGTIAPLDYVGKTITLDYVPVIGGTGVPLRLFTGRIDTPQYDLHARLLNLSCVDDLQNRVASLARSAIDSLIGGRYSLAVQGEILDNWDYAEARLTTVAGSLDAGASGGMRVTPWQLSTSWVTYGAGDLLYEQSILGSLPQRSTLVNSVTVEFEYRYPRLRQRYTTLGWSGTNIDMRANGWAYPKQQDILGAAGGSGWTVTLGVFYPAPASIPHSSGGFIVPDEGSIDMAILHLTQRHSQTVTEAYTLTVNASESIAANGELPHNLRGALESSFDGSAWESALDVVPLMPDGGEMDYAPDALRADADYAIQTLLDQANVKILGSHRGARLTNAVLCNPDLDLDKRITIATADMDVSGKVASVNHVLNLLTGSATSEFSIACFGAGGAGILTPDTLEPPTPPDEAAETQEWPGSIRPLYVNTFGVTPYNDNIMGLLLNPPETILVHNVPPDSSTQSLPNPYYVAGSYPVTGFRVEMPGVDDADRNPITKPVTGEYQVVIPTDTMQFTLP